MIVRWGLVLSLLLLSAFPARAAGEVYKLTALDLAVLSTRWNNRIVEVQARCFAVSNNAYRCVTDSGTQIDLDRINPAEARDIVAKDCDTLSKMMNTGCVFTIQFVYQSFDIDRAAQRLGRSYSGDKSIARDRAATFVKRQVCENEITTLNCIVP